MKCRFCNAEIEKGWKFCPKCGSIQKNLFSDMDKIVNRMFKEMRSMDSSFDKQAEVFDMSPMFRKINRHKIHIKPGQKRSGFTLRISRSGGKPPAVSVKTFGDVDKNKVVTQIRDRFGIKSKINSATPKKVEKNEERELKIPNKTEEPRSTIKKTIHKVLIDVELPKVKSLKDVSVKELENSIEIKAVAGDKGYFKILTKPATFNLIRKELKNGVLHLEFS